MKNKTLALLLIASSLVACESAPEKETETETKVREVQFTSSISAATSTKAAFDAFEAGDKILVSAFDGTTEYAKDASYSYGNSLFTSESPILYESEDQELTFLAVYPAINDFSSSFEFQIKADQSVEDNYEMSDLLTSKTGPTKDNSPQLSFYHRMSSIVINITSAGGSGGEMIINSKNQVSCDISAETFTVSGLNVVITPVIHGDSGFKAIIAPQTITGGTLFVTYTINDMTYTWKPKADLVFLTGKQYVYNWNLADQEITLESVINGWSDGGTGTIESEE